MTPKGPSPLDLESAAPPSSRRRLLGALGAAGLASATALTASRTASAAPSGPTADDKTLLRQAMELELTARDLYREAAKAGLSEEATLLAATFAANHAAYADEIAGGSGFSANKRNDDVYDDLQAAFSGSDDAAFVEAAMSLENAAAATHTSLVPEYEAASPRVLTVSIILIEARMATVLAEFGGVADDLNTLFEPSSEALVLTGGES